MNTNQAGGRTITPCPRNLPSPLPYPTLRAFRCISGGGMCSLLYVTSKHTQMLSIIEYFMRDTT
ncbi:MAG: hypothetical protein NZ529_01260 [Cytophagaceae bacterium]|nr:hypothetical protein [Cytophagaceae bacterium]MDW8455393.1 hypothetical protein [Cytophagaceae bacterium]